jgi:hypothetical protein
MSLTQLIPEEPALVGHRSGLRFPEQEPRVRQELVRHQGQHPGAVRVAHAQHLADLNSTQFYKLQVDELQIKKLQVDKLSSVILQIDKVM